MRFDDSLATVLAADAGPGFGAQAAWRQLVDLAGRGRVPDLEAAAARLRALRDQVPASVRAASARALAWGEPPAAMVALFAEDEPAAAAPVLRGARLTAAEWLALLPTLSPAGRAVLRGRRDLPAEVVRGLDSFGAVDFVLDDQRSPELGQVPAAEPAAPAVAAPVAPTGPSPAAPAITRMRPVEAALRRPASPPRFEIADLVARIDAFRRDRPPASPAVPMRSDRFEFHTDATGLIRWVEGVARGALIGVNVALAAPQGAVTLDGAFATALQARDGFRDVPVEIGGESSAAGRWLASGVARFDPATGRFVGLAGIARRRPADPVAAPQTADSLRQLVHELRTPANAIGGFAELIATELLGPVPPVYRERAQLIGREAAGLAGAIEDLDTAARLDSDALELRAGPVDLATVLTRAIVDLQPLAAERRVALTAEAGDASLAWADARIAARLVERLLTVALGAAAPGERLRAHLVVKKGTVRLHLTRPRALSVEAGEAASVSAPGQGGAGPLLGTGWTLRLLEELAVLLGGSVQITPERLTLRLPAAVTPEMERTTTP